MGEFRESRGGEGHGHVRPRSDGSRTPCGGPGFCAVCNQEAARAWVEEHRERDALKAEVDLRTSEVELFRDELKARCDEVAKLKAELADVEHDLSEQRKLYCAELASVRAACAVKDAAIRELDNRSNTGDSWSPVAEAALSDDAGKNYVDASGAVEAEASRHVVLGNTWLKDGGMLLPGDWAGASVLIIPKPKE